MAYKIGKLTGITKVKSAKVAKAASVKTPKIAKMKSAKATIQYPKGSLG